jgi:hypothetical protein
LCEWQKEMVAEGNCLQNALLTGGFDPAPISEDPSSIERARATCEAELAECLRRLARPEDLEECAARARQQFAKCDVSIADIEECTVDYAAVYAGMPPCSALTVDVFRKVLYTFAPPSCETPSCG